MGLYTKTPKWVMQAVISGAIKPRATRVLLYVVEMTRGYNRLAYDLSFSQVAEGTGLHVNHVRTTVAELLADGVIQVSEEGGFCVPDEQPNQLQKATKTVAPEQPKQLFSSNQISCKKQPNQLQKATKTVARTGFNASDDAGSGNAKKNSKKNNKKKGGFLSLGEDEIVAAETTVKRVPRRYEYTPLFEAFWVAYPGAGAKVKAFEEWRALGLDGDAAKRELVMQALGAQVADRARANGRFYPEWSHAERWLRNQRWTDKLLYAAEPTANKPIPPEVADRPWLGAWLKHGGMGVGMASAMNLAAALGVDPEAAQAEYRRGGLAAAGDWVWQNRRSG